MKSWNGSPEENPTRAAYIQGYIRSVTDTRMRQDMAEAAARHWANARAFDRVIPRQVRKLKVLLLVARWPRLRRLGLRLLFDKATARLLRQEFKWR